MFNSEQQKDVSVRITDKREENPYFYEDTNADWEKEQEQDAFVWAVKTFVAWLLIILFFALLLEKVI